MAASFLPYAYFEEAFVPFEDAKVSVATHALQYGTGVFGGIRGYLSADGQSINIFRLTDHCERIIQSAALLKIKLPFNRTELAEMVVALTEKNRPDKNVYYRPFAYKAGLDLTPTLSSVADGFALYMLALDEYYSDERGLKVMVSPWRRVSDTMIPARGKVSGAYVNSSLANDDARTFGFDEAIMLNEQGKISEGSAANIFMVRRGVLITPPVTADILEGITRRTVLQLAADLGIASETRDIDRTELYVADELFFCGTGAQITAISQVDGRMVAGGSRGEITRRLAERFFAMVRGELPEYAAWLSPVAVIAKVV